MNKKFVAFGKKLLTLPKKKPLQSTIIGTLTLGAVLFVAFGNGDGQYDYVVAQRRDVVQEVRVTGSVEAAEDVDLAFEETGTVSQVLADVGDEVRVGQILITLKNADELAALNQAKAQADIEIATLNSLVAGADQDLVNSYGNAINTIDNALAKSEDAIRSKSSGIFTGSKYTKYSLTFDPCHSSKRKAAETLRLEAELELDLWSKEIGTLLETTPSNGDIDEALLAATKHLSLIQEAVSVINDVLTTACATNDSSLDTARTNMATAQTNVFSATEDVNDLIQTIALNKISVADENDIAAQEARVKAAQANADRYRAELEKTIIRSPINGVVTKQDADIGETILPNTPVVSVISTSSFEIQINIPEVEVAEVEAGRAANITLDAYGDEAIFSAHVVSIDLSETLIGGVPNYKATLIFDDNDDRIRSGMTASVRIIGEARNSVIAVPVGSIFEDSQGTKVRVVKGTGRKTKLVEVIVETGITGSDGFTEIIAGLDEGELVEVPTKE